VCGFNDQELLKNDNEDCYEIMRSSRTVQVPCTFNKTKQYTVKVPRQVTEQRPRTVQYTDMVNRTKSVPYTVNRSERRTRMETQSYKVPITNTHTRMVPVTKKVAKTVMVPKTVYVDVTSQVPQQYTTTKLEARTKQVPVPYYVNVPETRYRTVTEQVPVQRTKVQMDTVSKIVYDTQVRNRCVPETMMCSKSIPVYNVRSKPPPPCRNENDYVSGQDFGDFGKGTSEYTADQNTENTGASTGNAEYGSVVGNSGMNLTDCSTGDCNVVDPAIDSGLVDDFSALDKSGDGFISYNDLASVPAANQRFY